MKAAAVVLAILFAATPQDSVSLAAYRGRLQALQAAVSRCEQSVDGKACDPEAAGPDLRVRLTDGSVRPVSLEWLRGTLHRAQDPKLLHRATLLSEAAARLAAESTEAEALPMPAQAEVQRQLSAILSSPEFNHVHEPSVWARLWNQLLDWFFRHLPLPSGDSKRTEWLAPAAWTALAVCLAVGLLWWLRRSAKPGTATHQEAARETGVSSLREWEQWQARAEEAARAGRWREAVHDLYWAAITRMEWLGRWTPNRARTPREYLRLLPPGSEPARDLRTLTLSFERCWYGYRPAAAGDFETARAAYDRLGGDA